MDRLPFRSVHLDFHTSECIDNVGSEFSEENFKKALIDGHISSITLFSKCHHGWSYHPTEVNKMHPTLKTDLLGRQLKVCQELGVRTQIYVSAGLDERKAVKFPHFRNVIKGTDNTLFGAHWHGLCLNNDEYISMLLSEIEEVLKRYDGLFDGLFLDICNPHPCVCDRCIDSMLKLGLDPENQEDVDKHRRIVYMKYTKKINDLVASYNKDLPIFYNWGNLPRNDREAIFTNTKHLELESLPTGGWGYDHFPMSAAYARCLGREFLGMTGKFHKSWGEFGGYKHPNALIYETALSIANGAKCSVGDQLHPLGKFDEATYKLIGAAYSEVEKKEKWCCDVKAVTDVAVFSTYSEREMFTSTDIGANRMMLEGKYLYDIIDETCDLSKYKLVIFPDVAVFNKNLSDKVNEYIDNGGKVILSGISGICDDGKFFRDFGVSYVSRSDFDSSYLVPAYDMKPNGVAAYLMYKKGHIIEAKDKVKVVAYMQDSYFNRAFRRFCSHANTPNNPDSNHVGAVISGNVGYIAWDIFDEYREHGALHHKQLVCDMLDEMLGEDKTLVTNLGSNGVVTLMEQKSQNRLVNHLLYAVTKMRGAVEVIEDAPVTVDTTVSIKLSQKPQRVYIAPEMKDIDFTYENGTLTYTVERFTLHGMVVIDM